MTTPNGLRSASHETGAGYAGLLAAAGIADTCTDPQQLIFAVRALARGNAMTEVPAGKPGELAAILSEVTRKSARVTYAGRRTRRTAQAEVTRAGSAA